MPKRVCVTVAAALHGAVVDAQIEGQRLARARQRELAVDPVVAVIAADGGGTERDVPLLEDLVVDRLEDVVLVLVAQLLHPALALLDPQRAAVGAQLGGAGVEVERRLPAGDVQLEVVAGLRGRAAALRVHRERRVIWAEPEHAGSIYSVHGHRTRPHLHHREVARRQLRLDPRPRAPRPRRRGRQRDGGGRADKVKAEILMRMGAMSMKLVGTVEVIGEGRGGAPRGDAGALAGGRRHRPRERRGDVPAPRRRRRHPHQRADHRQGRVDGRGRRGRRARRR